MALIRRENNNNREISRQSTPENYKWDPFRMMDTLLRWDPFRYETGLRSSVGEFVPRFDVKETKDAYVIKADLPGVKQDAVEVSVNGNLLTITGRREEEQRNEGDQYFTYERSFGSFTRSFALPDTADAQSITADLKEGVLLIQVPKRPEAQPKKISVGQGGQGGQSGDGGGNKDKAKA
jgi:HSP20 family protein